MKSILLSCLIVLICTIISCQRKDDCNFGPPGFYYTDGINGIFVHENNDRTPIDSFLRYDVAAINIVGIIHHEESFNSPKINFSLISSALACSPVEPGPKYKGNYILTSQDTTYIDGKLIEPQTNLADYFEVPNYGDILSDYRYVHGNNVIKLNIQPDSIIDSNFLIEFHEETGKVYKTDPIRVKIKI